jgi:iron-sulfur cluster assembly accessory protein
MITMSEIAREKVVEFIKLEKEETGQDKTYVLRVAVQAGGCNDLSYNLTIDEKKVDDTLIDFTTYQIAVDPRSKNFLTGIHIDYVDALTGAGFKINNPMATGSCECGNSFSV